MKKGEQKNTKKNQQTTTPDQKLSLPSKAAETAQQQGSEIRGAGAHSRRVFQHQETRFELEGRGRDQKTNEKASVS